MLFVLGCPAGSMLFVLEHAAGVYAVRARMSRRGLCCSCYNIPQGFMLFVLGCPTGVYDFSC